MAQNIDNDKLDWMYKGANSLVDREDYLLGKSVDKSLEQLNNEEKEKKLGLVPPKNHVEHECIPPSIRDFNKIVHQEQVDLSAKLQEDPLVAIKKQEEEARRQFLQNPIQLKKLQEALKAQESKKKKKKRKKKRQSDSEDDLDKQLFEKLKNLKGNTITTSLMQKEKKKSKEDHLDTILMHKYNQLKDKLSQKDLDDILAGKISDSDEESPKNKRRHRSSSNSSNDSDDTYNKKKKTQKLEVNKPYHSRYDVKNKKSGYHSKERKKQGNTSGSSDDNYGRRKSETDYNKEKYGNNRSRRETNRKYENKYVERENNSNKNKTYIKKSSSSSSSEENIKTKGKSKSLESKSEKNLERIILEKLRMLRNSKSDKSQKKEDNSDDLQKYSQYDSDQDEYIIKKKTFGLVRSDGTKIPLKNSMPEPRKITEKMNSSKNLDVKNTNTRKKMSDKEKEELRKQMMSDAVKRDKERSDNLKKHRQDNEQEEGKMEEFDKNFVHRELTKSQNNIKDVESRIRSKLNNIQRSSQHMNSNFSKRS